MLITGILATDGQRYVSDRVEIQIGKFRIEIIDDAPSDQVIIRALSRHRLSVVPQASNAIQLRGTKD